MRKKSKNGVRTLHLHDKDVIAFVEMTAADLNCSLYSAVEIIIKEKIKKEFGDQIILYQYGDKVRDTLTGYEGRITAMCSYYGTKPDQYLIENIDSTGRPIDWWIEADRIEKIAESEDE